MGGGISKQRAYVLKIDPIYEEAMLTANFPLPGGSSTAAVAAAVGPSCSTPPPTTSPPGFTRQSSKLLNQASSNNSNNNSPAPPVAMDRQKSGAGPMLTRQNSAALAKQSSSVGMLAKQGSTVGAAGTLGSQGSPVASPGAGGSVMSKQNSRLGSMRNMNGGGLNSSAVATPTKSTNGGSGRGGAATAVSSTIAVGGGRRVSARLPWLLKDGGFGNSTDLNSFEYGRVIGRGLMGSVRIAKHKQTGLYVAIKSIRKEYIQKHRDQRHVASEKEVLTALSKSPFCVKLFGSFQDAISVHFVMELEVGGELFRRLQKKQAFPPAVAKFYASEIFCALQHIHKLGYVYRDLKPENIMLDEEGHCKLVDFGFTMKPDAQGLLHTQCGTPAYLSPEQLNGKFTNGYTAIVDWWSFGILLYELLTGTTPFCKSFKESSYEIYLRILENHIAFPFGFDSVTKELVTQLCHADLSKRLVAPDIIAASTYWEIPWDAVSNRWLMPPHVPRINPSASSNASTPTASEGSEVGPASGLDIGGDVSQFDTYSDGSKPMEGIGAVGSGSSVKSGLGGDFVGF